jgi:pyruvate-formate lyase-activating enzyme
MATSRTRQMPAAFREAHGDVVPSHFISTENVLVAFAFHCNLSCTFCMVEDSLGVQQGVSLDVFRKMAADADVMRDVRRVVLSGGEVTLDRSLLDYVAVARSIPTVRHVRLQTNAMRLASPRFVSELMEAGVDEFFISLHGATAKTCDRITRVDGSFVGIMNGLENVASAGATLFTNTCITEENHRELPDLVALVAPHGPSGMDFWGLWPRLDLTDTRGLHARVEDVRPHLVEALRRCVAAGIQPIVKWYPRCLLGEYGRFQNDWQPTVLIQNEYWDAAPEFACIYEGLCAHGRAGGCAGLSEGYIHRFGWEERVLQPAKSGATPSAAPRRSGAEAAVSQPAPSAAPAAAPGKATGTGGAGTAAVEAWLEGLGLRPGDTFGGYVLRAGTLSEGDVRLHLENGEHGYTVFVRPRAEGKPAYAETASLALSYSRVEPERKTGVVASTDAIVRALRKADHGDLRLPS